MKTKMIKLFGLALLAVQLVSCGNANNSLDNIEILNSTNFPTIGSFASSPTYNAGGSSAFTSSSPYIVFNATGFGSYLAPARGIVSEFGISNLPGFGSSYYVTMIHSARIATKVHGLQSTLNIRPGDVVQTGSIIGTFFSSSNVAFQVLLDGTPICPLSFLSSYMRQNIFSNPCQQ
jgi:hypothetical protein